MSGSISGGHNSIFAEAQQVLEKLLVGLESESPGLITDLYITGSLALGDCRPDKSDIDLVLVRNDDADNATTIAALEPLLANLCRTHPRPMLDGLVLSASDLAAGPDRTEGDRPIIFDNIVRLDSDGRGRNPVTWETIRQCGIAYRGAPIDRDDLWHDPKRLDAWTRENLDSYWRKWLVRSDRLFTRRGLASLDTSSAEWGVLGVTRLHYTLATGLVTSKHGAGMYALETFPSHWHCIIREALRIRERRSGASLYRNQLHRRRDTRDFVSMVIDSAHALPAIGGADDNPW